MGVVPASVLAVSWRFIQGSDGSTSGLKPHVAVVSSMAESCLRRIPEFMPQSASDIARDSASASDTTPSLLVTSVLSVPAIALLIRYAFDTR
jgi:hypothetical protein